jgi:choice-of-anchor C domain-containing protein
MNRILVAIFTLTLCGVVEAAPFQNGSFENGSVPNPCNIYDLPIGSGTITGWTVILGVIDWEGPSPCGWVASNGSNSIDLLGQGGSIGGIEQSFDTIPGQTYMVSFDLAGNYGGLPVVKPLTVSVASSVVNFTFDTTGKSGGNMGWTRKSFTFVANSTSSTLSFVTNPGFVTNAGAVIDNVSVVPLKETPVPLHWAQWAASVLLSVFALMALRRRRGVA